MRSFKRAAGMTTSQYRQHYGHTVHALAPTQPLPQRRPSAAPNQ